HGAAEWSWWGPPHPRSDGGCRGDRSRSACHGAPDGAADTPATSEAPTGLSRAGCLRKYVARSMIKASLVLAFLLRAFPRAWRGPAAGLRGRARRAPPASARGRVRRRPRAHARPGLGMTMLGFRASSLKQRRAQRKTPSA